MTGFNVYKQASLYGLAGLGAVCLSFLLIIQWTGNPLKHQTQLILGAECSLENKDDVEEVGTLNEIHRVVDNNRRIMRDSMIGYQYPDGKYNISARKLEDLVLEENGKPIRSIILTTWRSGSTFLGNTIGEHPGNFQHFEPLADFRMNVLRGPPLATQALKRIRALLNCEYADLKDSFVEFAKSTRLIFESATYLWKGCEVDSVCFDHRYLSALCRLFPFQSMKLIRLRLHSAQELLADEELGVRIVLLVRDPRGTVRSRKHRTFCQQGPDCLETALLCADLVSDYKVAVELHKKYPHTFRVIRYEDLAGEPYERIEELSEFYGRDFHPKVRTYLDLHTIADSGGPYDTFRNTRTTPYKWKTDMDFEEVEEVQRTCATAMKYWGYLPAMNATHQREFNPITQYDLYS